MMFLLLALALLTNAQLNLDLSLVGGARSQLAGVLTADGQVVFAGGVGGILTTLFAKVDVVATVNDVVSAGQDLTSSRYALAAATSANFSIFAGGLTAATTFSADVDVYSAVDGTWNATTLAIARAHHAVASTADFIYVAGGQVAANVYTDSVEVFVSATGEIDAGLNFTLSVARGFLATATLDTTVYFAGGVSVNGTAEVSAVVDVYESTSGNLTVVELSEARQQIAAVAVGTQVFFAGGASTVGNTPVASAVVDIWDTTTLTFNTTALSVARWGAKAVVVGDLVVFVGGYTAANVASDVIDIYNVTAQVWVTATLSRARADFAAVAVDNKVYVAGGVSAGLAALITGSGSLEVLDFSAQPNGTETPTPTPTVETNLTVTVVTFSNARAQLAATVTGSGELLIAGGVGVSAAFNAISSIDVNAVADATDLNQLLGVARLGLRAETANNVSVFAGGAIFSLVPSTQVDVYYAVNNSWAAASANFQLTTARVYHTSAVVGTKIYFAGGLGLTTFLDTIEVYDTVTGRWSVLTAKLSVARGYLTASVVGDLIVFAGGRSGIVATAVVSDVVDVLDTVSGTITSTVTLSAARAQLASSVVGDLVLFGGGVEVGASASVVVDVYNTTSGEFLAATQALSVGRWALEAVTVGTDVYFVGGFDGTVAYSTVDIWSSLTGEWRVAHLTFPRYNFAATVDVSGTAYFCGGQNALGFLASVEIYAGEDVETPTPTPTGPETPTPTPLVTPTPTPGQTPTPTPSNNNCVQICTSSFDSDSDSWTDATDFTVRCARWTARLECVQACNDDNAYTSVTDSCAQTPDVGDFCPCARTDFNFRAAAAIAFIQAKLSVFVNRFNGLLGVVPTPANGGQGTVITVNTDQNTFTVTFTYEDSVQIDGQSATVDLISVQWSVNLGTYFGTSQDNFEASSSKKRAEQQGSLSVAVNDNASPSGVAHLSISFAFVLVTFLLHVLF